MGFSFNLCELCALRGKYSKSFVISSPDAASACMFATRRWNSHQILSLQVAAQYSLPDGIASFILSIKGRRKGLLLVLLNTYYVPNALTDTLKTLIPISCLFYRQENIPVWGPVSKKQVRFLKIIHYLDEISSFPLSCKVLCARDCQLPLSNHSHFSVNFSWTNKWFIKA